MCELTVIKQNGGAYIDSRDVAESIGKRHYDLCRDIIRYERIIEKITERKIPFSDFFLESSYLDSTGRKLPCYLVSKRGADNGKKVKMLSILKNSF
jgi:phage regulator Rha-like protein